MTEQKRFKLIKQLTGKVFARTINGVVIRLDTSDILPPEHIASLNKKTEGLYELSAVTCGGGMPTGEWDEETFESIKVEDTPENRYKYQCRVGRRAPFCESYISGECGRYYLYSVTDKSTLSLSTLEFINIVEEK